MNISHVESLLRYDLNAAIKRGIRPVAGVKLEHRDGEVVGCCALGALELAGRSFPLPEGAPVAIADGWDGEPLDPDLHHGLRPWVSLGRRLRRDYQPVRVSRST